MVNNEEFKDIGYMTEDIREYEEYAKNLEFTKENIDYFKDRFNRNNDILDEVNKDENCFRAKIVVGLISEKYGCNESNIEDKIEESDLTILSE